MNAKEFDKHLSEDCVRPNLIIVHPSRIRWSNDFSRARIETISGFYCYRYFEDKEMFILMGEAMNEADANKWVDNNSEIEMWT